MFIILASTIVKKCHNSTKHTRDKQNGYRTLHPQEHLNSSILYTHENVMPSGFIG